MIFGVLIRITFIAINIFRTCGDKSGYYGNHIQHHWRQLNMQDLENDGPNHRAGKMHPWIHANDLGLAFSRSET